MKIAQHEASSDLERARALSRSLSQKEAPVAVPRPGRGYTRLPSRRPAAPVAVPATLPELEPGARWPRIVAWARQATRSRAAFAVDPKGLLVAAAGIDDLDATRVGGYLALAVDQSSQIDRVRSIAIEWTGERVTGIEVRAADDVAILLGLLGHEGAVPVDDLTTAIREAIELG